MSVKSILLEFLVGFYAYGLDRYKDAEIVLTFVALPKSKALFRSAFKNHGRISARKAKTHYAGYDKFNNYLKSL